MFKFFFLFLAKTLLTDIDQYGNNYFREQSINDFVGNWIVKGYADFYWNYFS